MDVTKGVKRQVWDELQASAKNVQTDTTKYGVRQATPKLVKNASDRRTFNSGE